VTSSEQTLTALPGGAEGVVEGLQGTCARPGCSVLFTRTAGVGRPAAFCSETCRRESQTERRRLRRRLAHHEDQAQQLRLLVAAYERSASAEGGTADDSEDFLAPDVVRRAEDAVLEMRTMTKFVTEESGQYAAELIRFFEAVAPLIDHYRS
jgi:hypothetical protein